MKRLSILAAALVAGIPATARADILWDLVHDAGAPGATGSYGATSVALSNGSNCGATNTLTCGSITALSNSALFVTGNDYDDGGNNGGAGALGPYSMGAFSEKGLGLCIAGSSTSPNGCNAASPPFKEIDADASVNFLYLNLTGVLNSGALNHLWITSTQTGEDWLVEGTTGLIGGVYTEICHGTGNTSFTDVADCAVNTAVGYTFLKFSSTHSGAADTFSGDFSVQALRFNSIVPEPGTMGLLATGLVALTGAGFIRRRKKV